MYECPGCESNVQDFDLKCPRCELDVQVMAMMNELPDVQFNHALDAAKSSDLLTATSMLGAVLSARPGDSGAWYLLGLLHARRGVLRSASECWQAALMFNPKESRAKEGLEKLRSLQERLRGESS